MAETAPSRPVLPASTFDYPLPADRIAQRPLGERDSARMLHIRPDGGFEDRTVADLPRILLPGDLVVVNDTRVRAARLRGTREAGGGAEILVLSHLGEGRFACLVRPARRLRPGSVVRIGSELTATVGPAVAGHPGARAVELRVPVDGDGDVEAAIERAGTVPLPPYIREDLDDAGRYQTVFSASSRPESAAAPTAGLHLTHRLLGALEERGVVLARVRLEVGLGTFAPIRVDDAADHEMHEERFELPEVTVAAVDAARARGGRVVAVGTTTVRVLETMAVGEGRVRAGRGATRLYLRPGVPVRVVDGLLTNFHQPRSSLLVLLAAIAGPTVWRPAYDHALAAGYRFLSFGDCMLCWRSREPPPPTLAATR